MRKTVQKDWHMRGLDFYRKQKLCGLGFFLTFRAEGALQSTAKHTRGMKKSLSDSIDLYIYI